VDRLARSLADTGLPHPLLVDAARSAIAAGDPDGARDEAERLARALLQPVINATGVLLHTNLGRAPVAADHAAVYRNLELDLTTGERGSRQAHAGNLVARACGAEGAMVVNNGAAAVLLVLAALARGRGVAVSRGELVEIGGGFRVPEVMAESGARLVEVGTTNRTRPADFARAVADTNADVALVMKVHQSNYRITGFTEQVDIGALSGMGVPVVADIGSGLLDAACPWLPSRPTWLGDEPAARQTLEAGADLVIFSGDKLLGGPQAGIIAGRRELVDACGRHPLARTLRPGSLVLAAIQDTALAYLRRDGDDIAFWRMATVPLDELRFRAERILTALNAAQAPAGAAPTDDTQIGEAGTAAGGAKLVELASVPGGGTLPGVKIPSVGLGVDGDCTAALRQADPPIIARVHDGRTLLDLRTVDPSDDDHLIKALQAAQAPAGAAPPPDTRIGEAGTAAGGARESAPAGAAPPPDTQIGKTGTAAGGARES
jgi:L-seryl-tRNA(Ser) seleniumtransferase